MIEAQSKYVDISGDLIVVLSDGREINAGPAPEQETQYIIVRGSAGNLGAGEEPPAPAQPTYDILEVINSGSDWYNTNFIVMTNSVHVDEDLGTQGRINTTDGGYKSYTHYTGLSHYIVMFDTVASEWRIFSSNIDPETWSDNVGIYYAANALVSPSFCTESIDYGDGDLCPDPDVANVSYIESGIFLNANLNRVIADKTGEPLLDGMTFTIMDNSWSVEDEVGNPGHFVSRDGKTRSYAFNNTGGDPDGWVVLCYNHSYSEWTFVLTSVDPDTIALGTTALPWIPTASNPSFCTTSSSYGDGTLVPNGHDALVDYPDSGRIGETNLLDNPYFSDGNTTGWTITAMNQSTLQNADSEWYLSVLDPISTFVIENDAVLSPNTDYKVEFRTELMSDWNTEVAIGGIGMELNRFQGNRVVYITTDSGASPQLTFTAAASFDGMDLLEATVTEEPLVSGSRDFVDLVNLSNTQSFPDEFAGRYQIMDTSFYIDSEFSTFKDIAEGAFKSYYMFYGAEYAYLIWNAVASEWQICTSSDGPNDLAALDTIFGSNYTIAVSTVSEDYGDGDSVPQHKANEGRVFYP